MYDLNLRQRGMQKEIENQNGLITENDNHLKAFINDLLESHQAVNVLFNERYQDVND